MFRSLSHIYAQVIDDVDAHDPRLPPPTWSPTLKEQGRRQEEADVATMIGELVAERAKEKGVTQVVFDRGGYPFHGRIKALAEAARAGGLEF